MIQLWHLLLQSIFALKHLHLFVWHCLLPLWQSQRKNPCPPVAVDLRAWRSVMVHSVLTSEWFKSLWGQRSNWFLEYLVLRIPDFTITLYMSCSFRSSTTPRMFLGSPRPLSTIEIVTVTLSPTSATFKSIREHFIIISARVSWESCAHTPHLRISYFLRM